MAKVLLVDGDAERRRRTAEALGAAGFGSCPTKEGYEVCQFVKSHPRFDKTPALLISGIVNPAVIDRAARVGSAGVMRSRSRLRS